MILILTITFDIQTKIFLFNFYKKVTTEKNDAIVLFFTGYIVVHLEDSNHHYNFRRRVNGNRSLLFSHNDDNTLNEGK